MAKQQSAPATTAGKQRPALAVLFELENIASGGRRIGYEVLSSLLQERKTGLTPAVFSRLCLDSPPSKFIPKLLHVLDKGKTSAEKLLTEFIDQRRKALVDAAARPNAMLKDLLVELHKRGILVGAISELGLHDAAQHLASMGLPDMKIRVLPFSMDERPAPTADAWLKLARMLSASPSACMAVATGAAAARAAVSAGMRCVVVVDEFTTFQDFGGAEYVTETLDADAIARIVALLEATV